MKKKRVVLGILAAAGGLLGTWWLVKQAKKTYKELNRREEQNREILKKSGLTEEEIDGNCVPEKEKTEESNAGTNDERENIIINIPRKLFEWARFDGDSYIPNESLIFDNVDDILRRNAVHVYQRYDAFLRRNVLDFRFDIPESAYMYSRSFSTGGGKYKTDDFLNSIIGEEDGIKELDDGRVIKLRKKSRWLERWEKMMKDEKNIGFKVTSDIEARGNLEGYFFLRFEEEYEGEWVVRHAVKRIPRHIYAENPFSNNNNNNNITKFVSDIKERKIKKLETRLEAVKENQRNVVILDAFVVIKISFPMQDMYHIDGVNFNSALEIFKDIYDNLEVLKDKIDNGRGNFNYINYLFHSPFSNYGEDDYYTVKKVKNEDGETKYKIIEEEYFPSESKE